MSNASLELDLDFEVVERRTDVRIVVSLPGRFLRASLREPAGRRREIPCRIVNVTCYAIGIATPVAVSLGERVIVHVDEFGKFEGPVMKLLDGGFMIQLIMPRAERQKLAARIEWFDKFKNYDVEDNRRAVRIVPRSPHSTLVLGDGTTVDCLVKDISAVGVAVRADIMPRIGTPIAVGKVLGRVVRHFDDGFAIRFRQEQDAKSVESLIARIA